MHKKDREHQRNCNKGKDRDHEIDIAIQGRRIDIVTLPQVMTIVRASSMAGMMRWGHGHSRIPECFTLLAPPAFHSTPMIGPHHLSANSNAIHQLFDLS